MHVVINRLRLIASLRRRFIPKAPAGSPITSARGVVLTDTNGNRLIG